MLKIIIALVLVAHGIGHSMGLLQVFKLATIKPQWHGDSWLIGPVIGITAAQVIGVLLWTAAVVGFAALGAIVFGWLPAAWWQPLAVGSAAVSLAGVLVFPAAFPAASTVGAVAVDLVILYAVLWNHWIPSDLAA